METEKEKYFQGSFRSVSERTIPVAWESVTQAVMTGARAH